MPCLRAACIAAIATSGVLSESAQKIPPAWNQRTPCFPKISSQSKSSGFSWEIAVWPRSEHPSAARTPKPRSTKLSPFRTVRPTPSSGTHRTSWCTPPWYMRSSTRRPTGLSARAVTCAVSRPKQRLSPRATLYSPPPSNTSNLRVVAMRWSPGSKRSMTSPRLSSSQRHWSLDLIFSGMVSDLLTSREVYMHRLEAWRERLNDC